MSTRGYGGHETGRRRRVLISGEQRRGVFGAIKRGYDVMIELSHRSDENDGDRALLSGQTAMPRNAILTAVTVTIFCCSLG